MHLKIRISVKGIADTIHGIPQSFLVCSCIWNNYQMISLTYGSYCFWHTVNTKMLIPQEQNFCISIYVYYHYWKLLNFDADNDGVGYDGYF